MSVEFRQRKPAEYLKILRRRKWLVILPVIAITSAVAWVVFRLPDIYESTTLIVVRPSNLPQGAVPMFTEDSVTRQLAAINQVVTSRSSLEPLVEKYELYKAERLRGQPMESAIERTRDDINVTINRSRNDITHGFNISFRYRDPKVAQAITSELASKYTNFHTQETLHSTVAAKNFFDQQVNEAREALTAVDKQREEFMGANVGKLPTEAAALLSQLSGLREEQKGRMSEIGRLQDRRAAQSNNLNLLREAASKEIERAAENTTDPKTTMAYSQLVTRKAALEGELTRLQQEYKPAHPDVIAKQKEIDQVKSEMDTMIDEWKEKIKEKEKKLKESPNVGIGVAEADVKMVDGEIKRQQKLLADNEQAIAGIVDRLNQVPGVEVALGAIEREYQTKKAAYDALVQQQQRITLGAAATSQQQGEGIEVVDPANLPVTPVAPKRLMLSTLGLGFGLAMGLMLVGVVEGPRLLTIQDSEDARHYTGLPVLLAVPELLTPQEARSLPRRRKLLLAAGLVATVVSIPMLALALKLSNIFEFLMQGSGS
ncbi:MAG TPA: Wzz/FepE/Etk N-terminal domain-containing protein [Pyrinomonadaceae bacterium]|nr:Wzz/FepE/Etk N-terminal domain-containing protein [Pyrinomonadaceae bacterium]